jgi:hypothetical protein
VTAYWLGVAAGFTACWFLGWCRRLDVVERALTEPGIQGGNLAKLLHPEPGSLSVFDWQREGVA